MICYMTEFPRTELFQVFPTKYPLRMPEAAYLHLISNFQRTPSVKYLKIEILTHIVHII